MAYTRGNRCIDAHRSAAAKRARGVKKQERRDLISAKASGCDWGADVPNSDTPEKGRMRADAKELLTILTRKKLACGREPEGAVSAGPLECGKLGSQFLELAATGEHYAAKNIYGQKWRINGNCRAAPTIKDTWPSIVNFANPTLQTGRKHSRDTFGRMVITSKNFYIKGGTPLLEVPGN